MSEIKPTPAVAPAATVPTAAVPAVPKATRTVFAQKFFIVVDEKVVAELALPSEVSAALPAYLETNSEVYVIRGRTIPFKQTVSVKLNLRDQGEDEDVAE